MKKSIVILTLLFFLLGPAGIRPAQAVVPLALLNPATLGICVAAVGVIAAGTAYYAPQIYEAGQVAADTVTGALNSSLYAAKLIAVGAEQYVFGKLVQAEMAFDAMKTAALAAAAQYPLLNDALQDSYSTDPFTPSAGMILPTPQGKCLITGTTPLLVSRQLWPPGEVPDNFYGNGHYQYYVYSYTNWEGRYLYDVYWLNAELTSDPLTDLPGSYDPAAFAGALAAADSPELKNEVNNIIADNPSAVTAPGLTSQELSTVYDQAQALAAQEYAGEVLAQAQADPTNQELQALALEAQQLADQKALEAEKEEVKQTFIPPAVTAPARNTIDLSPFYDLQGLAAGKFPFSLVASISNFFASLAGPRKTPAIDWNYRGLIQFNISLSPWDPYAANLRLLIAFFFHAGILYAITRRWSR